MKLKSILVVGSATFPIDMLRYDNCWPADSNAVTQIEASIVASVAHVEEFLPPADQPLSPTPVLPTRRIKLYTPSTQVITVERWRSFGWRVEFSA